VTTPYSTGPGLNGYPAQVPPQSGVPARSRGKATTPTKSDQTLLWNGLQHNYIRGYQSVMYHNDSAGLFQHNGKALKATARLRRTPYSNIRVQHFRIPFPEEPPHRSALRTA